MYRWHETSTRLSGWVGISVASGNNVHLSSAFSLLACIEYNQALCSSFEPWRTNEEVECSSLIWYLRWNEAGWRDTKMRFVPWLGGAEPSEVASSWWTQKRGGGVDAYAACHRSLSQRTDMGVHFCGQRTFKADNPTKRVSIRHGLNWTGIRLVSENGLRLAEDVSTALDILVLYFWGFDWFDVTLLLFLLLFLSCFCCAKWSRDSIREGGQVHMWNVLLPSTLSTLS